METGLNPNHRLLLIKRKAESGQFGLKLLLKTSLNPNYCHFKRKADPEFPEIAQDFQSVVLQRQNVLNLAHFGGSGWNPRSDQNIWGSFG